MKVWPAFDNGRYRRLTEDISSLRAVARDSAAFTAFLELARDHVAFDVRGAQRRRREARAD